MARNKISVRIGGPAGYGIMNSGLMLSKMCARMGLHVFDYIEYPSLIRGGHNTYLVRAEDEEIYSQIKTVDILIALDEPTLTIHAHELRDDSIIIYDEKAIKPENTKLGSGLRCPMPVHKIVEEAHGPEIMRNTVALGAALGLMNCDFSIFEEIIKETFGKKKKEIVDANVTAAKKGYEYARAHYSHHAHFELGKVSKEKRLVLTGNEAIALGAVAGGLKFYAAYPMTPSSSILHTLAGWQEKYKILVKHAEDEISVANMTLGAGFAGCRAMCATSGGGFALMNETISLAGITESPLVVVEAMRGGPGTGLPTWTEQSDLRFIMHAGHGEFPKIVLAPGDVDQAYHFAAEALNYAEEYQCPVIIIMDKYLSESHMTHAPFKNVEIRRGKLLRKAPEHYLRYENVEDGISPRTIPGTPNGFFLANSDEHDYWGYSNEEIEMRNIQMGKRMRKLDNFHVPGPVIEGDENADITLVSWGSTRCPIRQAMAWLRKDGYKVQYIQFTHILPFPKEAKAILEKAKKLLMLENNHNGQMAGVIREHTGIEITNHMRRWDGRPFYPEDIYARVQEELQ